MQERVQSTGIYRVVGSQQLESQLPVIEGQETGRERQTDRHRRR